MKGINKRTPNVYLLPRTYEFPKSPQARVLVCFQFASNGLGHLSIPGVGVLPEHRGWQYNPRGRIAEREHFLSGRAISRVCRKRPVLGQDTNSH